MATPRGDGRRRRRYGQVSPLLLDEPGVTDSTRSPSSDVIVVHPKNKCEHGYASCCEVTRGYIKDREKQGRKCIERMTSPPQAQCTSSMHHRHMGQSYPTMAKVCRQGQSTTTISIEIYVSLNKGEVKQRSKSLTLALS
uniref:Uncharacterized protein n=1 Tax=Setaria viridis TaxID=4556 RepID=A0A4V6D1G9_SETVI|nr:hypothetical protein SEVIR_9G307700v2 [Setaria viridis]